MPRKFASFSLANAVIRFLRINADQTTSELSAAQLATALGVDGKLADAPSDGATYARQNGAWLQLAPPPFATHVTDISGWAITGGTSSLDGGGNATFDTPESVTDIQATAGFSANSVIRADLCPALEFLLCVGPFTAIPILTGLTALTTIDFGGCSGITVTPTLPNLTLENINLFGTAITSPPDLTGQTALIYFDVHDTAITNAALIDQVCQQLDNNGASDGFVDVSGTVAPTSASDDARANLIVRGWTIITD